MSCFKSCIVLLAFIACSISASAATRTSNAVSAAWNLTTSWVGGIVPVAGDDVIIADGANIQVTATVPATLSLASLIVGQGTSGILTFNTAAAGISVTGTTTVTAGGTIINTQASTATRQFGTLVVNGTWNFTVASTVTLSGSLTVNNGPAFTAGANLYTLTGTGQTIGGAASSLTIPALTITGGSYTNSIATLSTAALGGTGSLIIGANTTLNLTGGGAAAIAITTLNGTTNTPNTVTYSGSAPTVKGTGATYYNLNLSGSGAATITTALTVSNNLNITAGTFATSTFAVTAANTNVTGILAITGATATKALGVVNVQTGGAINTTAAATITMGAVNIANGGTISTTAAAGISASSITIASGGTWTTATAPSTTTILGDINNAGTFANTIASSYTIGGNINNTNIWNNTAASAYTIAGNITNDGTFTSGTGTYTLTGVGKTINTNIAAALSISSVTLNGTATYTVTSAFTSANPFSIPAVLTLTTASNSLINNGFMNTATNTLTLGTLTNNATYTATTTFTGGGTFVNATNSTLYYSGASINSGFTISSTGNTVVYNGATQTIRSSTNYYNITVAGTGVATMNANIIVRNNLSVLSGTLADGGFGVTGNATGQFTVAAGATFQMGSGALISYNFPTAFTTATTILAPTSTIIYNATTNSISTVPAAYGHLTLTGTGTKTAGAAMLIQGNLTINSGSIFADGGFVITVNGNITNAGSHTGSGSIYLNNGTAVHTLSGTGSFNNLELDDAQGAAMAGSFAVNGTLKLSSGTYAVGSFLLTLNGPAIAGTGSNLSTTTGSSLSFGPVGNANTGLYIPSSVSNLAALTINIVSTNTVSTNSDIILNFAGTELTLTSGRLDLGSHDLTIGNTAGTISGGASATSFVIADAAAGGHLFKLFASGATGTFLFPIGDNTAGADYSPVTFTTFTTTGGTETIGVNVTDAAHPQVNSNQTQTNYITRYWTFSESGAATSYSYATMKLDYPSDAVGTVSTANDQINRYDGAWSTLNSTVAATTASTSGSNTNLTGPLGGNAYTVRLNAANTYTWNNNSGGLWTTPANWTPTRTTPANSDILIFNGSVTPSSVVVTAVPAQSVAQLQVINGANASLQSAASVSLTLGYTAPTNALTIDGTSTLQISSTGGNALTLAFTASLPSLSTSIAGTLIVNANTGFGNTVNFANLTVGNNSITGSVINNGGIINATTATTGFGAGSFYTHNMNGGAIPLASWNPASTITVTGMVGTNITGGLTGTLGNLIWNNTAQTASGVVNTALTIAGDLTVTNGTLNFGAVIVTALGSVSNSGTINTSGGGTLAMNGTTAQTISGSGTWTAAATGRIFNLTINNTAGVTLTPTLAIQNNLTLTVGALTATALTIGAPAVAVTTIRAAGSLTNIPSFNFTTAAYTITYSAASTAYTTLNELPAAPTFTNGILTVQGAASSVTLDKDAYIGTLTTTTGTSTFNVAGFTLGLSLLTPLSNAGILTANASSSTIKLNGSATSQTLTTAGNYTGNFIANLVIDNPIAAGVLLGTQLNALSYGNVMINASRLLNLNGNILRIAGTYTNNGTINGTPAASTIILTGGSPQTFNIGVYTSSLLTNFTMASTSSATLTAPLNVSGVLTLTTGILTTTNTNLLTLTGTATTTLSGGSSASYINGPLARTLPLSLTAGSTYSFPIGKSGYNLFELISPTTSAAGTIVMKVEAIDAAAGGTDGTGYSSASSLPRYWQTTLSGAGAFTSTGTVRLLDASITIGPDNVVGNAATATGTYNNLGNGGYNTPTTGNLLSVSSPLLTLGCFQIGTKGCLSGHYTIGATGTDFTTLSKAITVLNSSYVCSDLLFELIGSYAGNNEVFPMTINAVSYTGGQWNVTFRPAAGVSPVTTGNPGSAVNFINLSGADYITFDGRAGGTGSTPAWIVRNTQTAATFTPTFQFINDATNDTLQYLQIESQNANTASGTIMISTATTTGNDNLFIDHNIIRDRSDATGTPLNAIYALGTAAKLNDNVIISNNKIFNFWAAGTATNAIDIQTNNTDFTISGNSIYQTASRTQTVAAAHSAILIASSTGGNFKITDNYIGGTAPGAGSTAYTIAGAVGSTFTGININASNTASSIQNNTISNINWSCTGNSAGYPGFFTAIYASGSTSVSIGDLTGNTIGATTGTGSITLNNGSTGGNGYGIVNVANGGPINISNNNVGSITMNGTSVAISSNFTGILYGGGLAAAASKTIAYNTIGSTLTPNNITLATASTNATPQNLLGISYVNAVSNLTNLQNNVIANLNNNYAGTAAGVTDGIYITSASNPVSITGNQVYNLATSSPIITTGATAAINGICFISNTTGNTISNNTVYGISNSAATAAVVVDGIYYAPVSGGTTSTINANLVHSLTAASTASIINGININIGTSNVTNNMVRLGINAAGSSVTTNQQINGIYDAGTLNNIYFNSVYIGGTGVSSGSAATYAYYGVASSGARAIQDNIFWNARTNSGSTGKHYAIRIGGMTNLTCNYNDLLSSGPLGNTAGTDYATLSAWQGQAGTPDVNSLSGNPQFINATGAASAVDLHISTSAATPIEATGTPIGAVPNDYDNQQRSLFTPTDIGADADNFIGIDLTPPTIGNATIASTCNGPSTYSVSGITITDASGVDVSSTNKPRLYYKKSTGANTVAGWQYVQATGSTSPFSFNVDFTALGGANTGDVIQYFIVAQDIAPAVNVGASGAGSFNAAPVSVVLTSTAFPIGGTPSSFTIQPCQGTVNVGSTEIYQGLTPNGGIFQTINNLTAGLTGDLVINITSDIAIEDGMNPLTNAKLNGYKVRIVPSAGTLRTISNISPLTVPMIPFNGVLNVTIDGSFAGAGKFLKFRNTHTTPSITQPTVSYYGSASLDTIKNTVIENNGTSTILGAVLIGAGTNTGIVISNNTITSSTAITIGNPANGVYSNVSTNTASQIIGNNIENTSNAGVLLGAANGSSWTISQNNIYQAVTATLLQSGISVLSGNGHIITRNVIGGSVLGATGTWANSGAVTVNGINLATLTTGTPTIVDSNFIKGFSLTSTGAAVFNGINAGAGLYNIGTTYGNTISNTTTAGTGLTTGILSSPGTSVTSITKNTIFALANTNASTTTVKGIAVTGTSTSNTFSKNLIYNLVAGTGASSIVTGIDMSGAGTLANNMIRLGYDAAGASIANTSIITGISKAASFGTSFYHNSVYIGGSGVGTAATNTYAFRRTTTASTTDDVRDNIFVNARANASTGGIHYAFVINANANLTSNYNIFYAPNTGGPIFSLNTGTTAINTLQAWNAGSLTLDLNSGTGNPNFASAATATPDLHVSSPTPAEGAGINIATVTEDYDGDVRASSTPVDIGADAVTATPVDIFRPLITVSGLTSFSTACGGGVNATITAAITDAGTGTAAAALWYRRTVPSATAWSYFSGTLTSGTANNGTWSFSVVIPGAVNGEVYQAYVVAADGATTPNLGYAPYDATTPVHSSVTVQIVAPNAPYTVPTSPGAPLSGVKTVGTGGNYATFNGAAGLFAAINAYGLGGNLTVNVISDITETTTTPLNQITNYCGGPFAVRIQPDGTTQRNVTGLISGSTGLISFNGADSVTIDGQYLNDGLQHLHFKNTSNNTTGTGYSATMYWYNDATHDTIMNTIVEGLAKGGTAGGNVTSGVIMLGTGASSGNSYNVFANNLIAGNLTTVGADGSSCLLFSSGSAGAPNANNKALNNNFKDFTSYNAPVERCYGIYVGPTGNGSNWSINGNSFYTTFPENNGTFSALGFLPGSSSTGNSLSGNYIGGSGPQCGTGTGSFKMMGATYSLTDYTETRYDAMLVNAGSATISKNLIKRIWIENQYSSGFVGFNVQGTTNATISGNTIGGSILSDYTSSTNASGADVIEVDGGAASLGYGYIYGIYSQQNTTLTADSNTFNYLFQDGNSGGGTISCIIHEGTGPFVITNNTNNAKYQSTTGRNYDSYTIQVTPGASSAGNRIENNRLATVRISAALANSVTSDAININIPNGMTVSGSIKNNSIFDNTNVDLSSYIEGIYIYGNSTGNGKWDISNNMIYLSNGGATGNRVSLTGIYLGLNSSSISNIYYNSVWIAGGQNTNAGVTNHAYAFLRSPSSSLDSCVVRNNILMNTRTGGNSATYFGAIGNYASGAGFSSDYNFLFDNPSASGGRNIIGYFNGTPYTTFAGWQSTGNDAHGFTATYNAVLTTFATNTLNPANLFTAPVTADLHIAYANGTTAYQFVDSRATPLSVTTDYDYETRDVSTPDIGADEFNTCSKIAITAQPVPQTICAGGTAIFGVKNTGGSPYTYVWQVSTDHGTSYSPLLLVPPYSTNLKGDTLTITGATAGLDSNLYRADVSNLCGDSISAAALLHIAGAPNITWESPASNVNNVCAGSVTLFGVKGVDGTSFQWQVTSDAGATWANVTAAAPYSISQYSDTSYLSINTVSALNGNYYRCVVSNSCGKDTSNNGSLIVQSVPVDTIPQGVVSICAGAAGTIHSTGTNATAWAWQYNTAGTWATVANSTPAGVTYSGTNTSTLVVTTSGTTAAGNYLYRAQLSSLCGTAYSDTTILNVMNANNNVYLASVTDSLLVETCPDGGWTYYSTMSAPNKWLFGINKNGNSISLTPKLSMHFSSPAAYDSVRVDSTQKALFTMNRHWNVTLDAGTIDTVLKKVSVRFFYDPADTVTMLLAARRWALAHPSSAPGLTTMAHSVEWFKTVHTEYDPANNKPSSVPTAYTFAPASYSYGSLNNVSYVELKNIVSFSGGTAAIRVAPTSGAPLALPVTLLYLTADAIDNKYIRLNWATASEINNKGFEIERSADGTSWRQIGWSDGHGNTNSLVTYLYNDQAVQAGIVYYYRLRQVDIDEHYSYSEIVSASLTGDGMIIGELLPNPAATATRINIYSSSEQKATIQIYNHTGQLVRTEDKTIYPGANTLDFTVSDLASGVYEMNIRIADQYTSRRLVVK